MTVIQPNSISGINSITVATGEALSIHGANGDLVSTLTNTSGIATYKGIHVGSGTTTANQGVIVGTGCSIVSDTVNELSIYTNNKERLSVTSGGGLKYNSADAPTTASASAQWLNHSGGMQLYGSSDSSTHRNIIFCSASNAASERLRITSAGLVGIGTDCSGSTSKFQLVEPDSTEVYMQIANQTTGYDTNSGLLIGLNGSELATIYQMENNGMRFGTNSAERLRIDNNGKLLLGHTTSLSEACVFQIVETSDNNAEFFTYAASTSGARLTLTKSRSGTKGTNTVVQSGDKLGEIHFRGADGSGYIRGATISAEVDGTPGTNDMPGRLVFSTTADGANSQTERLRIDKSGAWGIAGANYGTSGQFLKSGGSGAAVSWGDASGGIDEADIWRLTTSFQGNASGGYIGSNWERADSDGQNHKGTGMSESSGTFTFPSTGFWFVQYTSNFTTQYTPSQPHSHRNTGAIKTCIDGSSYAEAAASSSGIYNYGSNSYPSHGTATCSIVFDVTSTSNCKCRFDWGAGQGSETCMGSTSSNYTFVTFIRLADT